MSGGGGRECGGEAGWWGRWGPGNEEKDLYMLENREPVEVLKDRVDVVTGEEEPQRMLCQQSSKEVTKVWMWVGSHATRRRVNEELLAVVTLLYLSADSFLCFTEWLWKVTRQVQRLFTTSLGRIISSQLRSWGLPKPDKQHITTSNLTPTLWEIFVILINGHLTFSLVSVPGPSPLGSL